MATHFRKVNLSLQDLLGRDYIQGACQGRAAATGESPADLARLARERVDFYPAAMERRIHELLPRVGEKVTAGVAGRTARGATSRAFRAASHLEAAPLATFGPYRVGEDGRLYLTTKCEHYHVSLGHLFPGYALLERARRLGIPNATHNNTRGHITRLLEEELVRTAGGLERGDAAGLDKLVRSRDARTVNRVLNLETGSLATEAALKILLARFYRAQADSPEPVYAGRTPVLLVMGNDEGGLQANYHGTTILTQTMRGMWPGVLEAMERQGILAIRTVRPNHIEDLEEAFALHEKPPFKIAGFFHEIVMMNYGGRLLSRKFLRRAYALCQRHDVPTVVDEIQSCIWSPLIFLYREYGLRPSFVAVGKGMPGGEYPGSRVLFSAPYDNLPQFGALVTNGQEELTSLAFLITMRWAEENAERTQAVGETFEAGLRALAGKYCDQVAGIEGCRHLAAIGFRKLDEALAFTRLPAERSHETAPDG
jgi:4-aminobutyrate aminotransferase-like enzyme